MKALWKRFSRAATALTFSALAATAVTVLAAAGPAQSAPLPGPATITATPSTVYVPANTAGTTVVSWYAPGQTVDVYVSENRGHLSLFASGGATGSATAAWIVEPNIYVFSLYVHGHGGDPAYLLATTSVQGVLATTPTVTLTCEPTYHLWDCSATPSGNLGSLQWYIAGSLDSNFNNNDYWYRSCSVGTQIQVTVVYTDPNGAQASKTKYPTCSGYTP